MIIMNDEFERIWKRTCPILMYFTIIYLCLRNITINHNQDRRLPGRNSNSSLEHEAEVLATSSLRRSVTSVFVVLFPRLFRKKHDGVEITYPQNVMYYGIMLGSQELRVGQLELRHFSALNNRT
jgi:hypothetical protein